MSNERVGVRQLRQNLSVHLRAVKRGQALDVTERGEVVARLVPPSVGDPYLDSLISEGKATAPEGRLADLPPPIKKPRGAKSISQVLREQRARERF